MYFAVFCSILQYFDVSEQSHVSVRIEEAFQRYTQKKTDTYQKENPHVSVMYRPGDTWTPSIHHDTGQYGQYMTDT